MIDASLINLPWATLVTLASGYIGYFKEGDAYLFRGVGGSGEMGLFVEGGVTPPLPPESRSNVTARSLLFFSE
ncbi:hypothetical protein JMI38_001817 [Salmonella enterica]|uniref:Uncharacterized protein n=1 Tax=Salmonella enterica TaxID=28901 RepID=A0A3K8Y218_SALER|nr:hypothetical protein [Salmonella enterica]EAU5156219.1 hypothetical protein [Salmonella enterica]EAZ4795604.1 hypothetical protein [Salmonella enterica]EBA6828798.1 hypothetical protein [Salmonella enterica]EBI6116131.1 hypothetical protein [Salmonella enterica]